MRKAEILRNTAETNIQLKLDLDGTGRSEISTGVGFMDHMLTLFAKHGRFDLSVCCEGDTVVDDHHSVEDIGICLGMQLLFDSSEENIGSDVTDGEIDGLKLLRGNIRLFKGIEPRKIPHMGWNSINIIKGDSRLFKGLPESPYVYFVHSYYLNAKDRSEVLATADYGITFDCAIEKGNLFGCQFHPEKSGDVGLDILKNFCEV